MYRNTSIWVNGLGITPYPIIQYTPESTNIEAKNRCFEFKVVFPFSDLPTFVQRVVLAAKPGSSDICGSFSRGVSRLESQQGDVATVVDPPILQTSEDTFPLWGHCFVQKKRWAILLPNPPLWDMAIVKSPSVATKSRDTWQHWHPNSHHWKGQKMWIWGLFEMDHKFIVAQKGSKIRPKQISLQNPNKYLQSFLF